MSNRVSDADAWAMRKMREAGHSYQWIAYQMGYTVSAVREVLRRES